MAKTHLTSFYGYWRPDGRVGTRNHVLVLPLTPAANRTASGIQAQVPGTVGVQLHQDIHPAMSGYELALRVYAGWVNHPNVYATVLVALSEADPVAQAVLSRLPSQVRAELVTLEKSGVTVNAIGRGAERAGRWVEAAGNETRRLAPLDRLILATECGGSDACSGISANPSLGYVSDRLIELGGTSILAETTELIGAETMLAQRAVSPSVHDQVIHTVYHAEHAAMRMGVDFRGGQPAPGNMEGGITTIEEKSLGCVHKGGTSPVVEVIDYGERPRRQGLVVMDTPGHDVMQLVGMAASGAQVIIFTTGRGTPTGSAIVPVIKVSTRTALKKSLPNLIDFDAGPIVDGFLTVEAVGEALFRKMIAVANGERVAAERFGHHEFGIFQGWGEEA